jgi:hypothetical protein
MTGPAASEVQQKHTLLNNETRTLSFSSLSHPESGEFGVAHLESG